MSYGRVNDSFSQLSNFYHEKLSFLLSSNPEYISIKSIINRLNKIEILNYHQSIAQRQRKSYETMKMNLSEDTLFIEIDFKQKIKIGLSPRQINSEFYNQKQRIVLGFGIYYAFNSKIHCVNFDIISDNLGQKGYSVLTAFRYILLSKLLSFLI